MKRADNKTIVDRITFIVLGMFLGFAIAAQIFIK